MSEKIVNSENNKTIKQLLLESIKKNGFTSSTKHIRSIIVKVSDKNMKKEFEFGDVTWKAKTKSSLEKQLLQLERLLNCPSYHIMESPMRWWSEFRNFVKYINF